MSIAIVPCPKCNTLLLKDTVQCHRCRHVLRPELAVQFRDVSLPSDSAVQDDLETCKQCGETYRKGLVRCWSCGAFTRPEIEEAYYRLVRGHAHLQALADERLTLREITEEERSRYWSDEENSQYSAAQPLGEEISAVDDDFELSAHIRLKDSRISSAETPFIPLSEESSSTTEASDEIPNLVPTVSEDEAESAAETIPLAKSSEPEPEAAPEVAATPTPAQEAESVNTDSNYDFPDEDAPKADDADSLLHIAKQEESAVKKARSVGSFVVYCPMGCKIRVQERHRGKVGRCPKCQATFMVPMARQTSLSGSVPATLPDGTIDPNAANSALTASKYATWIEDVHLHRVVPQKLRIKADSLLKDFQDVDLGFDPEGLMIVGLAKPAGMFGGKGPKKKTDARTLLKEHLANKPNLEGLPAAFHYELANDILSQISMTQPTPPGVESLFGDILVFGEGRIAIKLPKLDDKATFYLSFTLTQFREFSRLLESEFGIAGFGEGSGVPLQDVYQTSGCQLSKSIVKELQNLVYYQKDPEIKLEVSGYRCKVCGTIVSETARATQKLGGANGKGIAKAKCPKCTKPMGNNPLYTAPASKVAPKVEPSDAATSVEETEAAPTTLA